jgi:hypothetical protein
MFTDRVVLRIGEIEGIIGDNLPISASRSAEWWSNSKGRPWAAVGWNVANVDLNNRTVTFIRVVVPEKKPKKKENKKTEFFKRPLRFPRPKRPMAPSKTRISQAQARLRNIERQRLMSQQRGGQRSKSAYEKRLFRPDAKPSTAD